MKTVENSSDKGILHPEEGKRKFELMRYEPSGDLAAFVEHYWIVKWDLRGQAPFRQTILSYPNVQLVFEKESLGISTLLYGVPSSPYSRLLQDEGISVGIKFKPGGFYPFWRKPVSQLTGLSVPIGDLFEADMNPIERRLFALENGAEMAKLAESFLRERLPERDGHVEEVSQIVEVIAQDRGISKVEDLSARFDTKMRTLQRLFSRYVGVSPKWVIRRFRLQEAAEQMDKGGIADWAALSAELGYYDQAHFIKDFKTMTGRSPEEYVRETGQVRERNETE